MSNLVKFLLMALIWAVFFFVTFKSCIEPEYCPDDGAAITNEVKTDPTPAPVTAVADEYSLQSRLGLQDVIDGSLWAAERDDLVAEYKANPDRKLEIYGHYYSSEAKPNGFADMGLLRADRIKQLLVDAGIPADAIETRSTLINEDIPEGDELFDAGDFAWAEAGTTERVIKVDRQTIEILFPYDKNTTKLSDGTENYLETLANQLKQTNERVTITGHTDPRGTTEYNQRLGQDRADFVKRRLVSYGAPAGRISTESMGESKSAGLSYDRARRAVLRITE